MADAACQETGFRILVSRDGLRADLLIQPDAQPELLTPERCVELLYEIGASVTNETVDAVRALIGRHETGSETRGAVVTGYPAEHGIDGYIEWKVDAPPEIDAEAGEEGDEGDGEAVDYYAQTVFVMVERGDLLGVLHPPTEGRNGRDIAGNVIRARDGKSLRVRLDENILQHPDGTFYAEIAGMLTRSRSAVAVRNVLEINGPVDFSTGHIEFDGDVSVHGGVKDKFRLQATGSIEIRKLVEAADIESGADCVCNGGVSGRGLAKIRTGGDLIARYLAGVTARVGGNLVIQRECNDAEVTVLGMIDSELGAIIGGRTTPVGEVVIGTLGSPGEAPTVLELGRVPGLDEQKSRLEAAIEELGEAQDKMSAELELFRQPGRVLSPAEKERLTEVSFEAQSAAEKINRCRAALHKVEDKIRALRTVRLTVQKELHAGVRICIGPSEFRIRRGMKGPMTVTTDERGVPVYRASSGVATPLASISEVRALAESPSPKRNAA